MKNTCISHGYLFYLAVPEWAHDDNSQEHCTTVNSCLGYSITHSTHSENGKSMRWGGGGTEIGDKGTCWGKTVIKSQLKWMKKKKRCQNLSYHFHTLYTLMKQLKKGQDELPWKKEMTFHDGTRLSPHYLVCLNTIHYFLSISSCSSLKYLHLVEKHMHATQANDADAMWHLLSCSICFASSRW